MAWFIGYAIGIAVVAVVVLLLVILITLAKRIAGKAEQIVGALEVARENTAPLWEVQRTNLTIERITEDAGNARTVLQSKGAKQ